MLSLGFSSIGNHTRIFFRNTNAANKKLKKNKTPGADIIASNILKKEMLHKKLLIKNLKEN